MAAEAGFFPHPAWAVAQPWASWFVGLGWQFLFYTIRTHHMYIRLYTIGLGVIHTLSPDV